MVRPRGHGTASRLGHVIRRLGRVFEDGNPLLFSSGSSAYR
ncbi:hypothetical protein [Rubrivirga sp.]